MGVFMNMRNGLKTLLVRLKPNKKNKNIKIEKMPLIMDEPITVQSIKVEKAAFSFIPCSAFITPFAAPGNGVRKVNGVVFDPEIDMIH